MTAPIRKWPVALTVAGSDSGGGAGIQADLKTFAAFKVHGTCAITCLTAQNPRAVLGIQPATPKILRQQLEAVFDELPPSAAKVGMLFSASLVVELAVFWENLGRKAPPLVVDPVRLATSGGSLLRPSAGRRLCRRLLPLASLVTPNLLEAEWLTARELRTPEDLRWAAREVHRRFGCPALVKGGHLRGSRECVDLLFDGRDEYLLKAPRVRGVATHGTGCTYSAAITANLALGCGLVESVGRAKGYVTDAIQHSLRVGRHRVLDFLCDISLVR